MPLLFTHFFSFLCLKIKLQKNLIFSAVQIQGESGFKNSQLIHTRVNVSTGCELLLTERIRCSFCCICSINHRDVFSGKLRPYPQHHFLQRAGESQTYNPWCSSLLLKKAQSSHVFSVR